MRTVIVADDAETAAAAVELALASIPGLVVALAGTGAEAWRLLERDAGEVCALITDLNLPLVDGFELIARVRADARHARLPIIVISADTDPHTPQRLARLGVDAYFPKPFSPAAVRRKLEGLLHAP